MKRDNELYAFRRHLRSCQYFGPGGRDTRSDKCDCPFHVDGKYYGERVRQSLKTRSRKLADRRLADVIRRIDEKRRLVTEAGAPSVSTAPHAISDADRRFLASHGEIDQNRKFQGDLEFSTWRKYRTKLRLLVAFCDRERISELSDVNLDVLEDYRRSRKISLVTWKVELQALRTFFRHCVSHRWLTANPAKEMKSPRNLKPNEVVPYTHEEERRILAACDQIGGAKYKRVDAVYERLRARAMVLLLRHTALRISDVCTLRKDAVSWDRGEIHLAHIRSNAEKRRAGVPADPRESQTGTRCAATAAKRGGRLPVLFSGMGTLPAGPWWESRSERWQQSLRNQA